MNTDISPASSQSSSTPSFEGLTLGCGRGWPHKSLQPPSFEGFPEQGMKEEKVCWLKQKVTEQWRYNFLQSDKAAKFCRSENARVKCYQAQKKAKAAAAMGAPSSPTVEIIDEDTGNDKADRAKEKSRLR